MIAVNYHNEDFPFEEIRQPSGDYFDSVLQAFHAGYDLDQIWSVTLNDNCWVYGPPGHIVNLLGYVATKETHDGQTYYEEYCSICEGEDS